MTKVLIYFNWLRLLIKNVYNLRFPRNFNFQKHKLCSYLDYLLLRKSSTCVLGTAAFLLADQVIRRLAPRHRQHREPLLHRLSQFPHPLPTVPEVHAQFLALKASPLTQTFFKKVPFAQGKFEA